MRIDIKPINLSVSNFFTLDHSSNIIDYFHKQCAHEKQEQKEQENNILATNEKKF